MAPGLPGYGPLDGDISAGFGDLGEGGWWIGVDGELGIRGLCSIPCWHGNKIKVRSPTMKQPAL